MSEEKFLVTLFAIVALTLIVGLSIMIAVMIHVMRAL